jgi:hypothetical protein
MWQTILLMVFSFALGRGSFIVWREEDLDKKEAQLNEYKNELIMIAEALEAKDRHIREKWQNMVTDFSKYRSMATPNDSGKWTDADDMYLRSWNSAEK